MLKTTKELIEYLQLEKSSRESSIICSLVNSILICGNRTDADAILTQYLTNPFDFDYSFLMPIFKTFGDDTFAEQIFNISIQQNQLNENADSEVLEILGHLQYAPVKQILANYIFESKVTDYYILKSSALGLLHFNCDEYQNKIEIEIEKCYGKNLFPEFVPALVCKLKSRKSVLDNLYKLGSEIASTDCNAGIILGFSLCGEEGKEYFKRVIFDQNWETNSTGTGTIHFTYQGLKNLDISFKELFYEIKTITDKVKLDYCLAVFFALLKMRIEDIEINKKEPFTAIYTLLFKWKNNKKDYNLIDLAEIVGKMDEAYEIKKLIEMKLNEEAILKNYIG